MMAWASDPQVAAFCRWEPYESREPLLAFLRDTVLPHPWFRAVCAVPGGAVVAPSPWRRRRSGAAGSSAMVAEAPFVVLKDSVAVHGLTVRPEEERATVAPGKDWPSIQISRKKAHGCGNHGHKLLEGLTLYLHSDFATDLGSFLSIGLSDEARRSIEAKLGAAPGATSWHACSSPSDRAYSLVYDSTDASLNMIPSIPRGLIPSFTAAPVFRSTGVARDHELVLLARRKWLQLSNNNYRVCVCTPETRGNAEPDSTGLWQVRKRCFPELPYALSVDEVFSFQGMLFWADLSQGLVYCSHQLPAGESPVEFGFTSLPRGYLVDEEMAPEPLKMGRTISCIGGCIRFVCIDRHSSSPGDYTVNVWTPDLDHRQWKDHKGFPCLWKEILRQAGFMDAEARDVVARYPVLIPGGALCLLLSNMPGKPGYICGFDMGNKSLLWSGTS
ncbi:hypothetical protein SETIT_9G058000v2 [Setaria italica]|uniref:DUF1618 domain-containing protein n=1 Tax=Setaria italica TaxID=4555 RepID=A0A368SDG1_SETIT|nr:hypothetical protein SETIT_9G058000v2 [Setaria italica]